MEDGRALTSFDIVATGLAPAELLTEDQQRQCEDDKWHELMAAYDAGFFGSLEEVEADFVRWRNGWRGVGRTALNY